ncbi:DUF4190 domain-containing protein [Allosaccharopolyspora coralli]|uniref:DUF4190 domain-containing protein n=1 Tax=Allosaccharopolyspora coralli TaxID=2665642 RepID=UPI001651E583|nr:DUF4190 domain-containing protein [Allosaccharopolyspora coralli]
MTSLVLGIIGVVFSVIPIIGVIAWPLVILGLIFGILGIVRASKGTASNRGVAIAGTALSAVGLVICMAWAAAIGSTAPPAPPQPAGAAAPVQGAQPAAPAVPDEQSARAEIWGEGEISVTVTDGQGTTSNTVTGAQTIDLESGFVSVSVSRSPSMDDYMNNGGPSTGEVGCTLFRGDEVVDDKQASGEFATVACSKMY